MTTAERLKRAHLRATPNRIRILEFLENCDRPLSHTDIFAELPKFDRVTLYRILDVFSEKNLIHRIQGTDGIWRFCAHKDGDQKCPGGHPHLLCEICGKMKCLTGTKLPHVEIGGGFHVKRKQFLIIGICKECAENLKINDLEQDPDTDSNSKKHLT